MTAGPAPKIDDVLRDFLNAADESAAQELLGDLITAHAEPVIRKIVRSRLQSSWATRGNARDRQESEDVCAEVVLQLIKRLRDLRSSAETRRGGAGGDPVTDFTAYVAVVTLHACDRYLRRKYPARHILRTKIRYLLTHHPSFMTWSTDGRVFYCGFAGPRPIVGPTRAANLKDLLEDPGALRDVGLKAADLRQAELGDLVGAIFKWARGGVELDDLVKTVWALTAGGKSEGQPSSLEDARGAMEERLADSRVDIAGDVVRRAAFTRLWEEVRSLPPRQRAVLLLNLRDGDDRSVTSLLPLTGVCSFRQIAEAVSMDAEELAGIWHDLPLGDAALAQRIGITRQQVINLRKSARERLARRMRDFL